MSNLIFKPNSDEEFFSGLPMERAPVPTWLVGIDELFKASRPADSESAIALRLKHRTLASIDGQSELDRLTIFSKVLPSRAFDVLSAVCQRLAMPSERTTFAACDERVPSSSLFCSPPAALRSVHLTWTELLRTLGLTDTGRNRKTVKAALVGLSGITAAWMHDERRYDTALLALFDLNSRSVEVVASPLLWIGPETRRYVAWIDLAAQRRLSPGAKRLHAWLSWWVPARGVASIRLELLQAHVWGARFVGRPHSVRGCRLLRPLLEEVKALPGWKVWTDERDMVHVSRPGRSIPRPAREGRSRLRRPVHPA